MITDFKIYENNSNDNFLDIRKSWDKDLNKPDEYEQDDFDKVKKRLVDYMMNYYDLEQDDVIGIIDYENIETYDDDDFDTKMYNTLYNTLQYEPNIKISELSDIFMKNDEGSYQLDLIEEEPENHPNYMRNKKIDDYDI